FSSDGRMLATGASDGVVRLWDTAGGKELRRFPAHAGPVTALAFTPDSSTVASGGAATVRQWDVGTGRERNPLPGHRRRVAVVTLAPDGRTLATRSSDKSVRLWDAQTGRELHRLDADDSQSHGCLAFTPDGRSLILSRDRGLRIVEVSTGRWENRS